MSVRHLRIAALAAILGVPPSAMAAPPGPLPVAPQAVSGNQALANSIVANLRQSGQLRDYLVDVNVRGGAVVVSGSVTCQPQREEVLRIVQGVVGVERVVDRLVVDGTEQGTIVRTQGGSVPPPAQLPDPLPGAPAPTPVPGGEGNGKLPEPVPMFRAPAPATYTLNTPPLPPYAWPTYAPYNNYSRVGYPQAYPANAFPYIGPFYPFPKVPLGWRAVKLEWDDGFWWFSRVGTKYNWWKVRFW